MAAMSSPISTDRGLPNATPSEFIRDPHWDTAQVSYTLQAAAPEAVQRAFEALRDAIEALAPPGTFWRLPPARLHVSAHVIGQPRHAYDKDAYWAEMRDTALQELASIERQPFHWRFDRLIAAPLGVIAAAAPDPRLQALRRHLLERVPPPQGCYDPPYPLVHCTLLRYAAPENLPQDFATRVAALPCHVDWTARRLDLLRNARYPSLEPQILRSYSLEPA